MSEQATALRLADEIARLVVEAEGAGLGVLGFMLREAEKEARALAVPVPLAPLAAGEGRIPRALLRPRESARALRRRAQDLLPEE